MNKITKTGLASIAALGIILGGAGAANAGVGGKGWVTESDDAAPTFSAEGIVFADAGAKATGTLHLVDFGLEETPTIRYTATGNTEYLHVRLVTDAIDGYTSLTVISEGPVTLDSTVYVSALGGATFTIAEFAAAYPDTDVYAAGFHFDSNAPEGASATVTSTNINGKVKSSR